MPVLRVKEGTNMNIKIRKVITLLLALVVFAMIATTAASAYIPYTAYNFDYFGEIVNGPAGYVPERVLFGADVGIDEFIL